MGKTEGKMSYQYHTAIVETEQGKIRLPVRSGPASSMAAFKDGVSFCNGSRPFQVVPLLEREAIPLIVTDRQALAKAKSL
jgi:hypothetical protein